MMCAATLPLLLGGAGILIAAHTPAFHQQSRNSYSTNSTATLLGMIPRSKPSESKRATASRPRSV